ncbi:MAG: NAD(P)/FAD-dependent oxidoreductase [Bacteroidales bacterium]|nr:MAG: NAD(P)/FAD-dependent oxidoreductase [Bacteroidales bacterium]
MGKYDVIIIGGGLGGLICSAILGKEGYRVCIIEKNKKIGGSLQTFSRNGVKFDVGVHYFGGFNKGQNLYQLFKYFGLHKELNVQRLDMNGFDRITFSHDKHEYPLSQGYDNFKQNLLKYFPKEKKALQTYIDYLKEMCNNFPLYNLTTRNKKVLGAKFEELNTRDLIASITSDKKLQNVLAGTNPLYAGEPEKTPFYLHALINNSYIESAWRCIGGGSQIAYHLMKLIKRYNGSFLLNSEVKRLIIRKGMVEAVVLDNGEQIDVDKVISNVHPAATMEMIDPGMIRKAYRNRILSLENTVSAFLVNIVLQKGFLDYWNYNRYHYKKENVWVCHRYNEKNWPLGMVIFMSSNRGPDGYAEGITIMSYMNFSDVARWANTFNTVTKPGDRGKDYHEFKKRKAEKLIDAAEEIIPGLRNHTISYSASTPLTLRDYLGTKNGAIYGIMKDCRNPLRTFISPRTKIQNLFLTGQNLDLHGLLGVTISSVLATSELLGMPALINKILNT